jgi:hypothetical protein
MNNQNSNYDILKAHLWEHFDNVPTDQQRGLAPPPIQKPVQEDAAFVDLAPITGSSLGDMPVREAIARRISRRQYTGEALTLPELSYLLWSTQGIRYKKVHGTHSVTRNVPSAGARHPFETYILANTIVELPFGLYRYLPLTHQLCQFRTDPELTEKNSSGQLHAICHRYRSRIHLDCYPIQDRMAVWTPSTKADCSRFGTRMPKSIPGMRIDHPRHLRNWRLQPG